MEYDPFSPEFQADPFPVYLWMLEEAPVFYSEKWGWWALSRWDDVRAAALDPGTFLSFEGIDIDDTAKDQSGPGYLPDIDNPRHDQIRKIVQPDFLPRRVAAHEGEIRRTVRELTRDWSGRTEIDVAKELSWPMPVEVFFDFIGLPAAREEGRGQLERWVHELKDRDPGDARLTPVAKAATKGIRGYFTGLIEERRRHPRRDVASHLVASQIDGVQFTDEHVTAASEVMGLMTVLFQGGVETTSGLTSTLVKLLAENPGQRELLRRDPSLIPSAVDEAVRYMGPLQLAGRTTSREVTLHGVTIPAGGRVVLVYGAANRDPRQFKDLCGDPGNPHVWRLGILRDPNGRGNSLYVHDRLQPGDTVRVRGPRNNFPLVGSPRYVFIAGGIGITPILPMIAAAEAAGAEWELVYGGRRRASMAFLGELARYGDRVSVRPQDETGLLDLESILGAPQPDTLIYCCGPEPLLTAVEERAATWPPRSLHVERFAPKAVAEPVLAGSFDVLLARSELTLTVPPGRSILEMVESVGVSVLSSCREGTCGTCETAVLQGEPDHRDSVLTAEERKANDCMMICVSRSRTPRLVLDL